MGWGKKQHTEKVYPGYLKRKTKKGGAKTVVILASLLMVMAVGLAFAQSNDFNHKVKENETLYSLSRTYNTSVHQIQLANGLDQNAFIKTGQTLLIPINFYTVEEGDTLEQIAKKLGCTPKLLQQINKMSGNTVVVGQRLIKPSPVEQGQTYKVQKGDSLSYVSMRFDVSQTDLVRLNDLESPHLQVGQVLKLSSDRPTTYIAQYGDTLYSLALKYDVTVDQLMQYNALNGPEIKMGQQLVLFSPTYNVFEEPELLPINLIEKPVVADSDIKLASSPIMMPTLPSPVEKVEKPAPPVAQPSKKVEGQPSPTHQTWEDEKNTVPNYKKAISLLEEFEKEARLKPLSSSLKGYHIVLDSGHGGNDPGAVVEQTFQGEKLYFIENKYNYDVTMRLYRFLMQHGATVSMTNLSPDHTIRNNDIMTTFVNHKNEVANDENHKTRLMGGQDALKLRLALVKKLFGNTPADKRLFVSLHMDSSPGTALGMVAVNRNASEESLKLAQSIVATNQRGEVVKENYTIITGNPAPAAVLVEVRNLQQESPATYNDYNVRQQDAEKIGQGILNYIAL